MTVGRIDRRCTHLGPPVRWLTARVVLLLAAAAGLGGTMGFRLEGRRWRA